MAAADRDVTAVAARQLGLLTRTQAIELGVSTSAIGRRLDTGRWMRIESGVYLIGGVPVTWKVKLMAACLATGGVASHHSAAALYGLDGFRPGLPHVTVPRMTRFARAHARVHQSRDFDRFRAVRREGIPVTPPARLALDLGAVVDFRRFERSIDEMVGTRLTAWDELLDTLLTHARPGRAGAGPLRALLLERYGDEVDESPLERALIRLLRERGVPLPAHQWEIADEHGFVARVDFAYPDLRIAIELDGKRFHLNAEAFEADRRKRNRLKLAGWTVLEFTWDAVLKDPSRVVREIRAALAAATTA